MTLLIFNTFINWIRDMNSVIFAFIMTTLFIAGILAFKAFIEGNMKKESAKINKVSFLFFVIVILIIAMILAVIR